MTALCPSGGPSAALPGVQDDLVYTSAVAEILALAPGFEWLAAFGVVLGVLAYRTPTFCATDPPAIVGLTQDEAYSILASVIDANWFSGAEKVKAIVDNIIWFHVCHCTGGTTPALPSSPTVPTLPTVIGTPTRAGTWLCQVNATGIRTDTVTAYTPIAGPFPAPATATSYILKYHSITGAFANTRTMAVNAGPDDIFANSSFVGPQIGGALIADGATLTSGSFGQAAGRNFYWICSQAATSGACSGEAEIDWSCTGVGSSGPASQCCPTDPNVTAQLLAIRQQVDLIQRNTAPFAYVPGATHSTLSGTGTLTVPTLIGIKLTLTTIPTAIGTEAGSPLEYFDAGWFSWGTTDGFKAREFISHSPQLSFPSEAAQYTRIGYSLSPGVVASIQELYAET